MKKLTKIMAGVAMLAVALTTFGCKNEAKYEAEKNIVDLYPDLKVEKTISSQAEFEEFITDVVSDLMGNVFGALFGGKKRATAKKPDAAYKQVSKFIKAITAIEDECIDENGKMIKDIEFSGKLDIAGLSFEDTLQVYLDADYEAACESIDKNEKLTDEQKAKTKKALEEQCSVEYFKSHVLPTTKLYDVLAANVELSRLFIDADVSIKDNDKDGKQDFAHVSTKLSNAVTAKNVDKIVRTLTDPDNKDSDFYFPIFAVAESINGDGAVTAEKKTKKTEVSEANINGDVQLAIAAATKKGLGGYITIKAAAAMDTEKTNAIKEADGNLAALIPAILACGSFEVSVSNGKKTTWSHAYTTEELGKMITDMMSGMME